MHFYTRAPGSFKIVAIRSLAGADCNSGELSPSIQGTRWGTKLTYA